jgi:hypothetical protein
MYEARDILTGIVSPISDPPTSSQMFSLRTSGYVFGPNQEVLRLDMSGMLRECAHGLPCRYYCGGLADKKCTQREFPRCGMADGACLLTNVPCNSFCKGSG